MPIVESLCSPPTSDTRQQPANASTSAMSFCTVMRSWNKTSERIMTIDGAVYSSTAAVDRSMIVIA